MPHKQGIAITVDAIIFGLTDKKRTHLLLVERKNVPFKGRWTFPGGFLEEDEELATGCARELKEETSLTINPSSLKQVGAFGKIGRDPRGRTITIAFEGEVDYQSSDVVADDDAANAQWWPLEKLPELAFDHSTILAKMNSCNL